MVELFFFGLVLVGFFLTDFFLPILFNYLFGYLLFECVNAILPASVIKPRCSSSRHRSRLRSVQWLFFLRGERRCASRPSGSRLQVESIHPKQSASSTTSTYGSASAIGSLPLYVATHTSRSFWWFFSIQLRNTVRSSVSKRVVIFISPPL